MSDTAYNTRILLGIVNQMKRDLKKIEKDSKNESEYYKQLMLYTNSNPLLKPDYQVLVGRFGDAISKVLIKNMKIEE